MNSASATGPACATLKVLDLRSSKDFRFHALKLASPGWAWIPGQFVMIRPVHWDHDPLGGRPLSIGDLDDDALHLSFQVVGKGTSLLARLKPGDEVLVWGPLGRGFEVNFNVPTMLLAGGMGIVPFVGLSRIHPRPENIEILFGHQYELQLPLSRHRKEDPGLEHPGPDGKGPGKDETGPGNQNQGLLAGRVHTGLRSPPVPAEGSGRIRQARG